MTVHSKTRYLPSGTSSITSSLQKHSFGSRLFLGLVLLVLYLPIVVVVIYSFNDNSARIPLAFTGWTTRWYGELLEGKGGYGT